MCRLRWGSVQYPGPPRRSGPEIQNPALSGTFNVPPSSNSPSLVIRCGLSFHNLHHDTPICDTLDDPFLLGFFYLCLTRGYGSATEYIVILLVWLSSWLI